MSSFVTPCAGCVGRILYVLLLLLPRMLDKFVLNVRSPSYSIYNSIGEPTPATLFDAPVLLSHLHPRVHQDIAVDGWALTMLSRENVGFASTCNTIGQTLGFFISQVGFLALYDPDVCNKYFRWVPSAFSTTSFLSIAYNNTKTCNLELGNVASSMPQKCKV